MNVILNVLKTVWRNLTMGRRTMVMVDLETLATSPQAAVVAIGAVKFTSKEIVDGFEAYIPPASAGLCGDVAPKTVEWWSKQDPSIRAKVFGGNEAPLAACKRFAEFCEGSDFVWAKPTTFDITVLRHLFKQMGLEFPFHFRGERDARTLIAVAKEYGVKFNEILEGQAKHDPLDDSRVQALQVIKILKKMRFDRG
jgi:DNA polymerase III epsilon subunit-like protein